MVFAKLESKIILERFAATKCVECVEGMAARGAQEERPNVVPILSRQLEAYAVQILTLIASFKLTQNVSQAW